jgi:hypothetical protein
VLAEVFWILIAGKVIQVSTLIRSTARSTATNPTPHLIGRAFISDRMAVKEGTAGKVVSIDKL